MASALCPTCNLALMVEPDMTCDRCGTACEPACGKCGCPLPMHSMIVEGICPRCEDVITQVDLIRKEVVRGR